MKRKLKTTLCVALACTVMVPEVSFAQSFSFDSSLGGKERTQQISFDNPLVDATDKGQGLVVEGLIANGVNVNKRGKFETSALMRAAYWGYVEIGESLIKAGAQLDAPDIGGATPLHIASREGHADFVKLLIKAGANVNAKDGEGWTPLIRAASKNNSEVANTLIQSGADVNAANFLGETALMQAVRKKNEEVAALLLQNGSDAKKQNNKGESSFDIARKKKSKSIENLLAKKIPEPTEKKGETQIAKGEEEKETKKASFDDMDGDRGKSSEEQASKHRFAIDMRDKVRRMPDVPSDHAGDGGIEEISPEEEFEIVDIENEDPAEIERKAEEISAKAKEAEERAIQARERALAATKRAEDAKSRAEQAQKDATEAMKAARVESAMIKAVEKAENLERAKIKAEAEERAAEQELERVRSTGIKRYGGRQQTSSVVRMAPPKQGRRRPVENVIRQNKPIAALPKKSGKKPPVDWWKDRVAKVTGKPISRQKTPEEAARERLEAAKEKTARVARAARMAANEAREAVLKVERARQAAARELERQNKAIAEAEDASIEAAKLKQEAAKAKLADSMVKVEEAKVAAEVAEVEAGREAATLKIAERISAAEAKASEALAEAMRMEAEKAEAARIEAERLKAEREERERVAKIEREIEEKRLGEVRDRLADRAQNQRTLKMLAEEAEEAERLDFARFKIARREKQVREEEASAKAREIAIKLEEAEVAIENRRAEELKKERAEAAEVVERLSDAILEAVEHEEAEGDNIIEEPAENSAVVSAAEEEAARLAQEMISAAEQAEKEPEVEPEQQEDSSFETRHQKIPPVEFRIEIAGMPWLSESSTSDEEEMVAQGPLAEDASPETLRITAVESEMGDPNIVPEEEVKEKVEEIISQIEISELDEMESSEPWEDSNFEEEIAEEPVMEEEGGAEVEVAEAIPVAEGEEVGEYIIAPEEESIEDSDFEDLDAALDEIGVFWLKVSEFADEDSAIDHFKNVTSEHDITYLEYEIEDSELEDSNSVYLKIGPVDTADRVNELCIIFRKEGLGCSTVSE